MDIDQPKRKIGSLDFRLILEASTIGLMLVVVMTIVAFIMKQPAPSLLLGFLSGAIIHLGCEFSGINQYYVDYYK